MATLDLQVSEVPKALEDTLVLSVGMSYFVSNDSDVLVFYRVASAAPAASSRGHPLRPYRDLRFSYEPGAEKTWVWTRDPPAALVITESG